MSKRCALCRAIEEEKDKILYQDSEIVILPTKYKKGHHKRIMAISTNHCKELTPYVKEMTMNHFIKFCKEYFDEEPTFALVEPTYATIPEHWHRIACDWFATSRERKQLNYTPHQAIPTKVKWKPQPRR